MAKLYVLMLIIAGGIAYGTKSWANFFIVAGFFSALRIFWKFLTQ